MCFGERGYVVTIDGVSYTGNKKGESFTNKIRVQEFLERMDASEFLTDVFIEKVKVSEPRIKLQGNER